MLTQSVHRRSVLCVRLALSRLFHVKSVLCLRMLVLGLMLIDW